MSDEASNPPYRPDWIDKLDVAGRQVNAAIRMFFDRHDPIFARSDPVVAHSVISAAHQILTDLCKARGVETLLRGKQQPREHRDRINFAANFFKHADRDGDARINIEPLAELNAEFLMDAVYMLLALTVGKVSTPAKIYASWFVSKHPDLFENVSPGVISRFSEFGIDVDDFQQIAALLTFAEIQEYGLARMAEQKAVKGPSEPETSS